MVVAALCVSIPSGILNAADSNALDAAITSLSDRLSKQLIVTEGKKKKIAIMDILNLQGQQNVLGRGLAEQLSVEMVMLGNVSVVDRANIDRIIQENKFARTLANPDDVKKLGQIAGLDAIAIGTVNCNDTFGELMVKVISIETAELIAAGRCKFDMTKDLMGQFGTAIRNDTAVSASVVNSGNGLPSSQESSGIAKKSFGNLEVVLKTVTPTSMTYGKQDEDTPVIRCSLEMFNRDLKSTVVIAANGTKADDSNQIEISMLRGELSDSNGRRWAMLGGMLKGLSTVLCGEVVDMNRGVAYRVGQSNPSGIVDYIGNGTRCEMGACEQKCLTSVGRFWTGSFSPILPGKSTRVTVDFVPLGRREGGTPFPASFQFDMELVIGSIMNDEAPEKAKDLALENLVFDKIVMPVVAKESKP
jgi:TolB-like protein